MKSFLNHLIMVLDELFGGRTRGSVDEPVNAKRALLSWVVFAVLFGGIGLVKDKTFDDFIAVFVVTGVLEIIFLPRYFIRKRGGYDMPQEGVKADPQYVKMEEKYMKIIATIAAVFLILLLILFVAFLANSKFHFWW